MAVAILAMLSIVGIVGIAIGFDAIVNECEECDMESEWGKCNFCKNYDICEGCDDWYCDNGSDFVLSQDRVIEMAKQKGISCTDVIALIER